jgi:hypothetical protein
MELYTAKKENGTVWNVKGLKREKGIHFKI